MAAEKAMILVRVVEVEVDGGGGGGGGQWYSYVLNHLLLFNEV